MGSLWEPYGKGVLFLGAPGNSLDIRKTPRLYGPHSWRHTGMEYGCYSLERLDSRSAFETLEAVNWMKAI